jgi:uncharacterized protein
MTADELSTPLGLDRKPQAPFRFSIVRAAIAASGLLAMLFLAWAVLARDPFAHDPFGGRRVAVAPATSPMVPAGNPQEQAETGVAEPGIGELPTASQVQTLPPAAPPTRTVTIIDGTSGKRQEIVIPAWTNTGGIDVQRPAESPRRSAPAKPPARAPSKSN